MDICGDCGAETRMNPSSSMAECGSCGRQMHHPTPPIEGLNNLCPTCRHPLKPEHDDFGCHISGCGCVETGASFIDKVSAVLPNTDEKTNAKPTLEGLWSFAPYSQLSRILQTLGLPDELAHKSWAALPDDVKQKVAPVLARLADGKDMTENTNASPDSLKALVAEWKKRASDAGLSQEERDQARTLQGNVQDQLDQMLATEKRLASEQAEEKAKEKKNSDEDECPICHGEGEIDAPRAGEKMPASGKIECPKCGGLGRLEKKNAEESRSNKDRAKAFWEKMLAANQAEGVLQDMGLSDDTIMPLRALHFDSLPDSIKVKLIAKMSLENKNVGVESAMHAFEAHVKNCNTCANEYGNVSPDPTKLCAEGHKILLTGDLQNASDPKLEKNRAEHKAELARREATLAILKKGNDAELTKRTEAEIADLKAKIAAADSSLGENANSITRQQAQKALEWIANEPLGSAVKSMRFDDGKDYTIAELQAIASGPNMNAGDINDLDPHMAQMWDQASDAMKRKLVARAGLGIGIIQFRWSQMPDSAKKILAKEIFDVENKNAVVIGDYKGFKLEQIDANTFRATKGDIVVTEANLQDLKDQIDEGLRENTNSTPDRASVREAAGAARYGSAKA